MPVARDARIQLSTDGTDSIGRICEEYLGLDRADTWVRLDPGHQLGEKIGRNQRVIVQKQNILRVLSTPKHTPQPRVPSSSDSEILLQPENLSIGEIFRNFPEKIP